MAILNSDQATTRCITRPRTICHGTQGQPRTDQFSWYGASVSWSPFLIMLLMSLMSLSKCSDSVTNTAFRHQCPERNSEPEKALTLTLRESHKVDDYGTTTHCQCPAAATHWGIHRDAFNNLLFFAAWPMLAACIALYMLRDLDTRWTVDDR
jgi:hypothetical protein